MAKTIFVHKQKLAQKMLEFEKKGLQSFGKYLDKQLKLSEKKKSHAKYKKNIEQQLKAMAKRLLGVDKKLAELTK